MKTLDASARTRPFPRAEPAYAPLPEPVPLAEQSWPEGTEPLVTVSCSAYNHAAFIANALDGFLCQATTFPVEIIVHDDASADGTAEILRRYAARHPQLIRTVLQTENQYSQGRKIGTIILGLAKGTFIAVCEGDDYWTDPRKLEDQVAHLRAHPEAVLCFHDVSIVDSGGKLLAASKIDVHQSSEQQWVLCSVADVLPAMIPTPSVMYRNMGSVVGRRAGQVVCGDTYFKTKCIEYGEIHRLEGVRAVHRRHGGGVWTSASPTWRAFQRLRTFSAIVADIDALHALDVCHRQAKYGCAAVLTGWRKRTPALIARGGAAFAVAILSCTRYLRRRPLRLDRVLVAQIRIILMPLVFLAARAAQRCRSVLRHPEPETLKQDAVQ